MPEGRDDSSGVTGSGPESVCLLDNPEQIGAHLRRALEASGGRVVLVPVDFSPHSHCALLQACRLADLMSAAVVVLHVMFDPTELPGYYSRVIKRRRSERIQQRAQAEFDAFLAEARAENLYLASLDHCLPLVLTGQPVDIILQAVDALQPEMVVMGSQGNTGLKRISIGSKAEQVVRLCPVPTTIVKACDRLRERWRAAAMSAGAVRSSAGTHD